ncbi:MAG TPA: MFS transporter [Candidatus Acidoferrales bacterium]|nr:MFS transporter [Candidatus Acidoferrales bacterium]
MPHTSFSPKLQRWALINVCLGQFLTALDSRSVIVALPTLSVYFRSSLGAVQWIPLAYQLTVIGFVLSSARLGDRIGRRKLYALGFVLLAASSLSSALSGALWQLIALRVLAGLGGAMVLANGRALVSTLYWERGRGRALGMTSMAFHLGYVTGPSLGGLLIDALGWRAIFFANLPVALAAALMAWRALPETAATEGRYSVDSPGMAALLLTAVSFILGLEQIARSGLTPSVVAILAAGAIFLRLLLHIESKSAAPLLDLSLFRSRLLSAGVVSNFFIVVSHSATFFLLPFYLQGILHFSPTEVGFTIIFFSLVVVFLAPIGGWLGDRLGSRLLCTAGAALSVVSMLGFSRLAADATHLDAMVPLMILGLGWSLFQAPNLSAIFGAVESRHVGAVSGISLTGANVANATGVAVGSLLFLRWLNYYGLAEAVVPAYTEWVKSPEIFIAAFRNSWLVVGGLTAISIASSALRGAEGGRRTPRETSAPSPDRSRFR